MYKTLITIAVSFYLLCNLSVFAHGVPDAVHAAEYIEVAQAYTEIKNYERAITWYKKALKSPEYGETAQYQLARVYALNKNWKEAAQLLQPLYEKSPENTVLLEAYAYVCAVQGEADTAIALYKKYYDLDRENPRAGENYVRILISSKQYDDADAVIKELLKKYEKTDEEQKIKELQNKIVSIREAEKKAAEDAEKKAATQDNTPDAEDKTSAEDQSDTGDTKTPPKENTPSTPATK